MSLKRSIFNRRASMLPAALALCLLLPAAASAGEFGLEAGSFLAKAHATIPLLSLSRTHHHERLTNLAAIEAAAPLTQAGAHPDATTSFQLSLVPGSSASAGGRIKDASVALPAGFIGDPEAVPACPLTAFANSVENPKKGSSVEEPVLDGCTAASQVGVVTLEGWAILLDYTSPVYEVQPPPGFPAAFGFQVLKFGVMLLPEVRSGGDYGLNVAAANISASEMLTGATVTFWGVPASPIHNSERYDEETQTWGTPSGAVAKPFLTNPSWCESGPLTTSISIDSWNEPGHFLPEAPAEDPDYLAQSPQPTGCEALRFGGPGAEAALTFQPAQHTAETPSAYQAKLTLPYNESPEALANPTLRNVEVTLPEGVVIDPAGANGLQACSEAQIGYVGQGFPLPRPVRFSGAPAECPEGAKIGSVEVKTPLLDHPLKGAVYVARQVENPFGSLLAIYVAVYDPETGIVVKLAGEVSPNPQTGRLTATFSDNPQLPFTEFALSFFGGAQAALTTPATCGAFTTSSLLSPWSAPQTPPVTATDAFAIETGPHGAACVTSEAQQPHAPSFEAGTVNPAAGAYAPFALRLTRADGSQRLRAVDVTLPPGVAGKIAGIEQCPQADIALAQSREGVLGDGALEQTSPSCPMGSLLGAARVTAGAGEDPLPVSSGKVYFAGPYAGAPFSLVIVTPAVAGPYDLGTVVVRAALFVDPHTAQVSVRSDPIPSILHGIPLDIRSIEVTMTRPQFTFNPTSCAPASVNGTVESLAGVNAAVSDRFQAADCAALPFKPTFKAQTGAHHTRKHGASLKVAIAAAGGEANLAQVHVKLPKALPSELATLKMACTEAQFAANPAGCPQGAFVGSAVVRTPVLNVPLKGPAIFVSHGGAAFPDLDLVLQGEGVTIIQEGHTFINKKGITSSTFAAIPDLPVSSIVLSLPAGGKPALAGEGNLCAHPLAMPTTLTAQNGAVIQRRTIVAVQGCPRGVKLVSHAVRGDSLKLRVQVPGAGRLTASGKGLRRASKRASSSERLTLSLKLRRRRGAKASHGKRGARRPGVKTRVRLVFVPQAGKRRLKTVSVSVGAGRGGKPRKAGAAAARRTRRAGR